MAYNMKDNITQIDIDSLEKAYFALSQDTERKGFHDIASNEKRDKKSLYRMDDFFTILVRSFDRNAVMSIRDLLRKEGFQTMSHDTYGLDRVRNEYILQGVLSAEDIQNTLSKTAKDYLSTEYIHSDELQKNEEGDSFFYFFPIKRNIGSFMEFKKHDYLDRINEIAKKSRQSVDLVFSHVENRIFGGIRIPGIAKEEFHQAYFQTIGIQCRKDIHEIASACCLLDELLDGKEDISPYDSFRIFFFEDEPVFYEDPKETYFDYPNEIV